MVRGKYASFFGFARGMDEVVSIIPEVKYFQDIYNIIVIAIIKTQKADVYVNNELVSKDIPFNEPVTSFGRIVAIGEVQHIAGTFSSDLIIAINKAPEVPIFKVAHYGIIGDVLEVLSAMINEFGKIK